MKKYIFLLIFICFRQISIAQFVTIPDSNFRNYIIENIDSNAIVGNKLDTTNVNVTSLKTLEIYFFNNLIEDLEGIKYFDSLEVLKINFLYLDDLPDLPPQLKRLEAQANLFDNLPALPSTLQYMDVSYNDLNSLGPLPPQLEYLFAGSNHLQDLHQLPASLIVLRVPGNEIAHVDSFPPLLQEISIWDNRLDSVCDFPSGLKTLNLSNNKLKRIPLLPDSLNTIYISYNNLSEFPVIPSNVSYLDCSHTISCLPVLPNSIVHLNFDGCLSNQPSSLQEYYPVCNAPFRFTEVADTAVGVCNDTLQMNNAFVSYMWSTGATTSFIAGICRGIYSSTTTDTLGCVYQSEIDITDSTLQLQLVLNTKISCAEVGVCGYVADLTVKGGTPPYRYKWNGANGEIDFGIIADSTQDLVHFCLSDVLSSELLSCIVTDAAGRKDTIVDTVFDNLPPKPYYVDIVNPVCAGFATGYIYLEDDPLTPGGDIFIMETGLDAGDYIYTVPFGNNCEQTYSITLDYQFKDCSNMYSYNIIAPDTGLCNGSFDVNDLVDHGIYNLGNTEIAYDGMYLSDGNSVNATDLCLNTWYYFFVYDFNIGYFIQDSIYITEPGFSDVYPGDANSDGVADNKDILALGIALNESGYSRSDNTISWNPKPVQNWMQTFADSTNFAHADCNGDGIVKAADTVAILANYGMQHSRNSLQLFNILQPVLYINLPDTVIAGATLDVPVLFGDASVPADSVYGLAFTLSYDSVLVDPSSVVFVADSSWMGKPDDDLLHISKVFTEGFADVGYTRNDHTSLNGFGTIGHIHLRIRLVADTTILVASTSDIIYTDEKENYRLANASSDTTVILPANCDMQASLYVTNHCYSLYGGQAEVAVTNASGSVSYTWSMPAGSQLPYTFTQNSISQDSIPTAAIEVLVVDASGCRDTVRSYVSSEDGRYIYATLQNPTCGHFCDGWIWMHNDTVTGPSFATTWNTGKTGAINTGLCHGVYVATLNWGAGCVRQDTFLLADPKPLNYTLHVDSATCNECNGSAELNVIGGRKPYFFDWQSVSDTSLQVNDSTIAGLCFNSLYVFTINDGCNNFVTDTIFFNRCDSAESGLVTHAVSDGGFIIAPNPNSGSFTISVTDNLHLPAVLQIYNAQGSLVHNEVMSNDLNRYEVNMQDKSAGLYICTIVSSSGVLKMPFLVK
ncbi:MAG: T9SS type A sorting domain-containing protein [Bacteroidota bacterium]